MNRFTQSYVVGAVSGTAMVAAAIVAFVVLISFQAVRDWPGSGIGIGHDDSGVAVSPARKAPPGVGNPVPAAHPAVSAAAVARTAAPPAAAPGHRQARSHHHGTAVDTAAGRGGVSRGSQLSGTPARGGAPAATPVAQPAPTPAPASPAQPANGNGHGAANTNATGTSSPGNGGGPSGSGGNGAGQGNGNGHGAGPHGAAAENGAPTTTAPQAYATPTPAPEAPPAEAGNGHGNAYGHENDTTPPGNSEHSGGSGH